jgi:predicted transposase YbfD/YdcC
MLFLQWTLYTQKKTFDLILSLNCHFLAQIKRNCRKLWETCALYVALAEPISTCEYYIDAHGNQINRRIELYVNNAELPKGWNGIQRLVKVRRWGFRNHKTFDEVSYYALSKPINSAKIVADAVQSHWGIENNLHWIKDVNLGEDKMTLKDKNAVTILVYLNNLSINILKANNLKPSKDTYAKIANKVNELVKLFKN